MNEIHRRGLWYFFITSIFYIVIAFQYAKYLDFSLDFESRSYFLILTFSHFFSFGILGYLLFLTLLCISNKIVYIKIVASLISAFIAWYIVLDILVYNLYRMHINLFTLNLLLAEGGGNVFYLHLNQYIILGSIFLILFVGFFLLANFFFTRKVFAVLRYHWIVIVLVFIGTAYSHFIHGYSYVYHKTKIMKISSLYPLYFPVQNDDIFSKFKLSKYDSLEKDHIILEINRKDNFYYPLNPILSEAKCKKNIILILLDSWRYQVFDSLTMPNIYKFSKECQFFKNHYSGSNATRSGVFSLFYSIPGIYWQQALDNYTSPVFIELLLKYNYRIRTFSSSSLLNPPFNKTVFGKVSNLDLTFHTGAPHDNDASITNDYLE